MVPPIVHRHLKRKHLRYQLVHTSCLQKESWLFPKFLAVINHKLLIKKTSNKVEMIIKFNIKWSNSKYFFSSNKIFPLNTSNYILKMRFL